MFACLFGVVGISVCYYGRLVIGFIVLLVRWFCAFKGLWISDPP